MKYIEGLGDNHSDLFLLLNHHDGRFCEWASVTGIFIAIWILKHVHSL
jgi:hypothetical protein